MPVIKGLFFDLDGTLADTDEALHAAYSQAFAAEGHSFVPKDAAIKLFPRGFSTWSTEFPHIPAEKMQRIAAHKAHIYPDYLHLVRANTALVELIKNQRPHHTLVLVTTARRVSAERVIEAIGLKGVFHYTVYGDDVTHSKPHPEAYQLALQKSGLTPDEVIVFEDSEPGLQAALNAGLRVVKVAWRED